MHIHIPGICGTFMGSLALLARELGHRVTGSDSNVYPPMSTLLEAHGIDPGHGFDAAHLDPAPDLVVIGNALSRGNVEVEAVLDRRIPYTSGPRWLFDNLLCHRRVLAVAGTHGKTTTAAMLAWILEREGHAPGFLIGGVPGNFSMSARAGEPGGFFVIEADEYDTAFFDKRSKFVHYGPEVALLNNLEFDHADIFDDLAAIERQFHHLVRTVPGNGRLLVAADEPALDRVLARGCWTPVERFGSAPQAAWQLEASAGGFTAIVAGQHYPVGWTLSGEHNRRNGLAAMAAAAAVGISPQAAARALQAFRPPRRRQELRGRVNGIEVIDDFAHHPTAIALTLEGLRAERPQARLIAVIEPRSNTMKLGAMKARLPGSVASADRVWWYQPPGLGWQVEEVARDCPVPASACADSAALIEALAEETGPGDRIVIMSNGGFDNIHERLLVALRERYPQQTEDGEA
ncbi:UDP-N-acetylmuramate:L-alanyl-gamma-D-glutamyl-meso-diaminopimelate ligase [Kushneria aurantia]|uniref:UDP-N-acetylmuramate--L-alanyl-gamma-D-glutamyl-meso-2,6-diaminoheptandioate ligase n=1 Tax=Kushneria aurantia TaxID=504092 RepID=A0ABV6G2M4_9GAMM|nr:UDP-N-acetylmuramate:L-alanyl-gamma-D-glutamyl-meso-diaminopimelate ligase [Kushneria aurantia]